MRGVVSLAAALSIPVQLADGSAFPQRNLILFITFIVILLTLLVQGLTLPYLIKKIHMPEMDQTQTEEEADDHIRKELAVLALLHLKNNYGEQLNTQYALQQMARKWEHHSLETEDHTDMAEESKIAYRDILNRQRQWLLSANKVEKNLDEEIIRKHLLYLDLEEEKLRFL